MLHANAKGWPQRFSAKFIEPGLVHYDEYGTVLVKKEVIDKMLPTFIGRPVINEMHADANPENFDEIADGIITNVRYEVDGWYWADFIVWDDATKKNCASPAYSVSCAYDVKDFKSVNGEHNNIPYQQEVLGGEFTHMAIVANPRYEGARIVVYNSKGGAMKEQIVKLFKKVTGIEKTEIKNASLENAVVEIDGKDVKVSELIAFHKANLQNSPEKLSADTVVEIDGQETPISDLVKAYRLKNADDKEAEEKEKKAKEKAENERKNAEDEDKKKKDKEDEEMKNAEEAKKKEEDDKKKKDLENSKGEEHFNKLAAAAKLRGEPQEVKVISGRDRQLEGKRRYGSEKAA